MAKSKKFGTFGGVFTPSILTILGVIMYLRLPWIAGQAGLYMTIGIILLAHLISVTTGLSVSSIATDKKVKAGGTYFMISRSLGLPIGGTLGLALFVGLSFSVSLYLIGFAESFLSYWNFPVDKNTIRLTGTIILIAVTIITFISTSLAIKTQYIIMTAIGLSLISIVLGKHDFVPSETMFSPIVTAAPFIVLFGIFFPAVTGFEAGVSMSGDLRDPKKSIPGGTIAAIAIGLVVYIALAFFFSTSVSSDLLVNDPNALLKISWIPELVIAGIWGATLSSALGSILGAPRILQATSVDKITPKFFGKGFGESNEPRNALLLTFVIAEAGILIGDLDVIARIVSMFFITTYGFLNLSCAIEKWASSDFHPEFKVPGIVSLIGSAACFIVMLQLDFIAMVGATIILGALFIYLKRKELTLETGDTWEGIWASMVRTGLTKLRGRIRAVRNWRPNIILFSGGFQKRPHLVEISKAISGKLGVISNFDLVEEPNSEMLFSSVLSNDDENLDLPEKGIFSKRLTCKNIFKGIEAITRVYGFTGIEPNTVLMGWARDSKHAEDFAKLIKDLDRLDYNVIFLDYDKEKEFGEYKTIDLWWKGLGNNFSFALTILRFIKSNSSWKEAHIRILFIVEDGASPDKIYKNTQQVLDQYRIDAEIKIINNGIERKSPTEIIRSESAQTDLTILGLSDETKSTPVAYIEKMNSFMDNFGSVMLIHSSSFFEKIDIGISRIVETEKEISFAENKSLPALPVTRNEVIAGNWEKLDQEIIKITSSFCEDSINQVSEKHNELLSSLRNIAERQFDVMLRAVEETDKPRFTRLLNKSLNDLLFQINRISDEYRAELDESFENIFKDSIESFKTRLSDLIDRQSKDLVVHFYKEDLKAKENESLLVKIFKLRKKIRARFTKKPITIEIKYRQLLQYYLKNQSEVSSSEILNEYGLGTLSFFSESKSLIDSLNDSLDRLLNLNTKNEMSVSLIEKEQKDVLERFDKIENQLTALNRSLKNKLLNDWREHLSEMNELTEKPTVNFEIERKLKTIKSFRSKIEYLDGFSYIWNKNYKYFIENFSLTINSLWLKGRLKSIQSDISQNISTYLRDNYYTEIESLQADELKIKEGKINSFEFLTVTNPSAEISKQVEEDFEDARELYSDLPEKVEIPSAEFFIAAEERIFKEAEPSVVQYRRLAEHLIQTNFIESIQNKINDVGESLIDVSENVKDIVNLTNFSIGTLEDDLMDQNRKKQVLETSVMEFERKINKENQIILNLEIDIKEKIEKDFIFTAEPLSSYSILKASTELGQSIRHKEGRKVLSGLSEFSDKISKTFRIVIVNLIYGKSKGRLFARRQKTFEEKDISVIDPVLRLVNSISPNPAVYSLIPYYYKKLFSGTSRVSSDFRVGMNSEFASAATAIRNYKAGYFGGLLILGERNSGKTTLSRMIASKYFRTDRIFSLKSPGATSAQLNVFEQMLKKSTNIHGSIEEIITALPQNSTIIINDLELWWERSEKGFEVIDAIAKLIRDHSNKILFIVNCNIHSFRLMNTINKLDDLFISTIQCEPFDSEALKEIILLRHDSSGIKFKLGNKLDEELGEIKLAGLFDDYFNYSNGNVGIALNAWIANITKVESNTVTIKHPVVPDTSALHNLDDDWLIYISQILLHRRISTETLKQLMNVSDQKCDDMVKALLRSGIILEKSPGVYGINFFLEPYLTKLLKERMVII
ncbi:MAG: amino acid permease [Ignavibacteriaceae bacterium]|nr:amino acid permease [Ignavibacteriaceae bacterium]